MIGKYLKQQREGKPLTVYGDGSHSRDFTHVDDIVRANILAAESDAVGSGEIVNTGAGNNVSIVALAHMIGNDIEHVEARTEPAHTLADTTRAKELLGWEPQITIEEGIERLKQEYLS